MRYDRLLLATALAATSLSTLTAQSLATCCPGFPANLFDGGPAGPATIGNEFAMHWARPTWICTPPAGPQFLILGNHRLGVFDFGGPCRTGVCTVIDVAPLVAIPGVRDPAHVNSGWVIRMPADPDLRGSTLDMQVVAATCVTFLPNTVCFGTARPFRVVIR